MSRPNSHQFFGRGRVLDEILARLRQQRLIAVVGPSGSGKSSLVLAGLLPLLRMNALPGSAAWRYLPPIVPGSDPLASLQRVFEAAGITIAGSESDDRRVGSESSTSNPSPPIVLVVDQFEELFTLCDDPAARAAFVKQLQALVIAPEARHVVILTMRSDFETFVARLPEFQSHFDAGRVQVTPLSATELREAIEKPAEQVGLKFEPGVVDLLLQDLLGEPAGLPLLQFTLLKLWERRRRNQVTRAIYDEVGGGRLALARSADTFYASLIPQDQATARRILLRLVRPGEGMEFTSSRVRRETLYRGGDDPDRIDRVLAKLIQARLVRQTGSGSAEDIQIEIAHEALARNWPTLVEWLEQRKAAIVARRRLDQRAADWVRLGQGAAGLFDETELYEAEQWLQGPDAADLGFDPLLPTLVQTSKGAIAQDRERRIAQQVELETVQRIAETEQRRATEQAEAARRLRQRSLLLIVALTVALIALAATIVAVVAAVQSGNAQAIAAAQAQESAAQARHSAAQARTAEVLAGTAADNARAAQATAVAANQRADAQLRSSRSRVIAAEAIAQLDVDHERSILLALEAVTREHNVQTEDALRRSLLAVPLLATLGQQGHPTMQRAAYSPDGKYIVTASWDGVASVWEVKSHNLLFPIQTNQSRLHAAAYSPDGSKIAIAGQDGTIKLWDVKTRQFLMTLTGHAGDVNSVAYSRDGRRLVSAGADTTAIIWDVQTGQPIATLKGHTGAVNRAAFSPDGGRIVTASDDKTARLWDAQSGKSLATLVGHTEPVNSAVFSPSGDRIVTASNDNLARVWNAQTGRPLPIILVGHTSWVLDAAFSPDGRLIATASSDNTVKIWYASLGQEYLSLHSHSNSVQSVVFSSDGANVLTASSDGTAKLWVARPGQEEATLLGHINSVLSAAYSPDGKHIVTASFDQTARIWDTQTGHELVVLRGHTGWVYSAVYSPDGRTILTAGTDGTARIWDAATGQPIKMLTGHAETVRGAAFSPDGRSIVTASTDRTVRIWDVQSGQERLRLEHPSGVVACDCVRRYCCQNLGRWERHADP